MAVPRPVLIAILGMGLMLAALLATRTAGQGGEAEVTPAAPAQKPAAQAAPKAEAKAAEKPAAKKAEPATQAPEKSRPEPKPAGESAKPADSPMVPAARALASDKVVVLFISRGGAADDTATRGAVESLKREYRGRVAVFTDGIQNLPLYQPLLAGVGVSQVPSLVIVRPGRRARLIEGYVDKASLRQHVTDALR